MEGRYGIEEEDGDDEEMVDDTLSKKKRREREMKMRSSLSPFRGSDSFQRDVHSHDIPIQQSFPFSDDKQKDGRY